jgi:hypothetical protein
MFRTSGSAHGLIVRKGGSLLSYGAGTRFGEKVRRRLQANHFPSCHFARTIGMDTANFSRLMNGIRRQRPDEEKLIESALLFAERLVASSPVPPDFRNVKAIRPLWLEFQKKYAAEELAPREPVHAQEKREETAQAATV